MREAKESGLSGEQAGERRKEFGANELAGRKRAGMTKELWTRCKNPLVIQPAVICLISLWQAEEPADYAAAALVGAMIFFSVVLAYIQEHRSSQAVEKLQAMGRANCEVLRDGRKTEVPMTEIVPGDIVVLHAEAIIPADLRLLSAKDFLSASRR